MTQNHDVGHVPTVFTSCTETWTEQVAECGHVDVSSSSDLIETLIRLILLSLLDVSTAIVSAAPHGAARL